MALRRRCTNSGFSPSLRGKAQSCEDLALLPQATNPCAEPIAQRAKHGKIQHLALTVRQYEPFWIALMRIPPVKADAPFRDLAARTAISVEVPRRWNNERDRRFCRSAAVIQAGGHIYIIKEPEVVRAVVSGILG